MKSKADRQARRRVAKSIGPDGMTLAFDLQSDAPRSGSSRNLVLFAVMLSITAMTAVGARSAIVRTAPRTAAAFEAVGLPVNLSGLALDHVAARIVADGERRILIVTGDIVNASDREESARPLSVTVRGDQGDILYNWITQAPRQKVAAGERAAFLARLASPPAGASGIVVEFDRSTTKGAHGARLQGSRTESQ
ncbi:MAG: hypothetical protein KDA48_10155 [Amphiplicatus sp.]|nr:hypothetical protein [Amphiplicatus sp.]